MSFSFFLFFLWRIFCFLLQREYVPRNDWRERRVAIIEKNQKNGWASREPLFSFLLATWETFDPGGLRRRTQFWHFPRPTKANFCLTCDNVLSGHQPRMSSSLRKTSRPTCKKEKEMHWGNIRTSYDVGQSIPDKHWKAMARHWLNAGWLAWYPHGMSSSSGASVSHQYFHSFSFSATLSKSWLKISNLLSSTRFSQMTSSIQRNGLGFTALRSRDAPPLSSSKNSFNIQSLQYRTDAAFQVRHYRSLPGAISFQHWDQSLALGAK